MSDGNYKHDVSDKKLVHEAEESKAEVASEEAKHAKGPGHDAEKIARHDDVGQDRLFEQREQHDDAEKKSEKARLAKEAAKLPEASPFSDSQ